jgi:hypothetical protein
MDSNHDKVIQSHLCYRYTTRQKGGEFGTSDRDNVNPSTNTGQAFEKACWFAKAMEDTLARLLGFSVGMIFDPIALNQSLRSNFWAQHAMAVGWTVAAASGANRRTPCIPVPSNQPRKTFYRSSREKMRG